MCRTLGIALLSSVVALSAPLPLAADGINIGGSRGISVDVNTSDGLGVDASVGGRGGVNANANVGGSRGIADVDASVGGSRGVNASANVNGGRGLSADVDASVGGEGGLNASVGAQIGGSGSGTGIDVDVGLGRTPDAGNSSGGSGPDGSGPGGLTAPQRQALRDMSPAERQRLLTRCGSITASGYDPALVELCRLLRLSASR
jgi:hypothetical protein